jgi:hypothetical protein
MTLYNTKQFDPRDYVYSCDMDREHPNKTAALKWVSENIPRGESWNQLIRTASTDIMYKKTRFGFVHKEDYVKFCLLWL